MCRSSRRSPTGFRNYAKGSMRASGHDADVSSREHPPPRSCPPEVLSCRIVARYVQRRSVRNKVFIKDFFLDSCSTVSMSDCRSASLIICALYLSIKLSWGFIRCLAYLSFPRLECSPFHDASISTAFFQVCILRIITFELCPELINSYIFLANSDNALDARVDNSLPNNELSHLA